MTSSTASSSRSRLRKETHIAQRTPLARDLAKLRKLKRKATESNAKAKADTQAAQEHERNVIERMAAEDNEGQKAYGYTFSPVSKNYASIQDRTAFVKWALENDAELVEEKERKTELDRVVRTALDDGQELPPGVGFYTKDYISIRKAS